MKPTEDGLAGSAVFPPDEEDRSAGTPDDPQMLAALEEYLAAVEAGKRPDRNEFLARHAAVAGPLAKAIEGLEFIQGAASRPEPSTGDAVPASPEPPPDLNPLGDYRILREVGRGGMGVVYEAEQLTLGRRVALKVLPLAAALDPRHLQRFRNEAHAAAHLNHPHIVPVIGVGCERGIHYYAMQFIEGQTLAAVIQDLRSRARGSGSTQDEARRTKEARSANAESPNLEQGKRGSFGIGASPFGLLSSFELRHSSFPRDRAFFRAVAQLGVQSAEALEHAHQLGVIHRDIKPGNLLVDGKGDLWVTDFGLAQFQGSARLTMTGDVLGTLRYMSPEQALVKSGPLDHRTDVYALGATLYELLTLEPAFPGADRQEVLRRIAFEEPRRPRRWNPAIPAELETIVLKALAKDPADRYATARELADDLRRFLEDKPIRARRPTLRQVARQWVRRHRGVAVTAGVAAALLLSLLVAGLAYNYVTLREAKAQVDRAYQEKDQAFQKEVEHKRRAQQIVDVATQTFDYLYLVNMQTQLPREEAERRRWQQLVTFYQEVTRAEVDDPEVLKVVARAFNRLAIFQWQLGHNAEAKQAHLQAIARAGRLVAAFPQDLTYRFDLAGFHDSLAQFLKGRGDRQGAVDHYQKALEVRKELAADFPDNVQCREALATGHMNLALLPWTKNSAASGPRPPLCWASDPRSG